MATNNKHPENLDDLNKIQITSEIRSYINTLSRQIDEEKAKRSQIDESVDRLEKLRYGVRPKKTHPWPGAANYSIPLIDTDISRLKPSYVNLAFQTSPIVTFEPFGPEDVDPARKRELLFDWRLRTQVDFFKPYCYGVDQILGPTGQTVFRTIWKFSTRTYTESLDLEDMPEDVLAALYDERTDDELLFKIMAEEFGADLNYEENVEEIIKTIKKFREGKKKFEPTFIETAVDRPEIVACNIVDDLVVPMDTKDINDARFIDYKFWMTKNDVKIAMRDEKYEEYSDSEIDSWTGSQVTDGRQVSDDMILMHEVCCWYDIDDDGIEDRCIVTYPDASPESVLRFIELPYDHGQWPYTQVKRELTEDWFYATRGIPSLNEDFQVGISTAVNQAVDNGTLTNMPVQIGRKGILSNPRNRRFVPGEFIEVNGSPQEYEMRQSVNSSQPVLFQQAQFLKSFSDARNGSSGGFSGQTDLPGMGERGKKTAKEVEALVAQQGQAQGLDLMVFQQQMVKLYSQIDALYNQFGSDEEQIAITNGEPIRVSRQEIQGRFNIVPNGRFDNSTPQLRLQKKMFAFNIGFQSPFVKQKELINEIFQDIDPRLAQILLKSDEELQQEQMQALQQSQQMEGEAINKQISLKKVADDLEIRKQMLLVPIQGKKFAPN